MFPRWNTMWPSSWSTSRVVAAVCPTWSCTRWCSLAPWAEVCDPYQVPRPEGLGLGASKRCRMSHRSFSCFHIMENFQIWNLCMHGLSHRSVFCFHIFDSFLIWSLWHFIWHFGHNFLGGPPYIFLLCRSWWSGKLCASVLNLQGARRFTFWSSSFTSWWLMKATAAI